MLTTIFYAYGCLIIATFIYGLIVKEYKDAAQAVNMKLDAAANKERLQIFKGAGMLKTIFGFTTVVWPFIGLWMPEFGLFLTLVIITIVRAVLTFLAKTPQARIGVSVIGCVVDIILMTFIMLHHYQVL